MITNVKNGNLVLLDTLCDGLKLDEPPIAPPNANEADLDPCEWISLKQMHTLIELYQFWPLDAPSTKMMMLQPSKVDYRSRATT